MPHSALHSKSVLLNITSLGVTSVLKETFIKPLEGRNHPSHGPQRIYRQGWEKQPGNGAGRTFPKFDDGVPWGKKGSNTLALIDQINQRIDTYRTLANNL